MEDQNEKCCVKEHKDIADVYFYQECLIYFCNKCLSNHQGFFQNHQVNNLDNNK